MAQPAFITASSIDTEKTLPGTNSPSAFNVELGDRFNLPRQGVCGIALSAISLPRSLVCRQVRQKVGLYIGVSLRCTLKSLLCLMVFYSNNDVAFNFANSWRVENSRDLSEDLNFLARCLVASLNDQLAGCNTGEEREALMRDLGKTCQLHLKLEHVQAGQQQQPAAQQYDLPEYSIEELRNNRVTREYWSTLGPVAMLETVADLKEQRKKFTFFLDQWPEVTLPQFPHMEEEGILAPKIADTNRRKRLVEQMAVLVGELERDTLLGVLTSIQQTNEAQRPNFKFSMEFLKSLATLSIEGPKSFFRSLGLTAHPTEGEHWRYLYESEDKKRNPLAETNLEREWQNNIALLLQEPLLQSDAFVSPCIFVESPQLRKTSLAGNNRGILCQIPITARDLEHDDQQIHYRAEKLVFQRITEYNHGYIILKLTDLYGRQLGRVRCYGGDELRRDRAARPGEHLLDVTVVELAIQNPM